MIECIKLTFKEMIYGQECEFIFDEQSLKVFREEFWENEEIPLDIISPLEIQQINISNKYPKDWSFKCPSCDSFNCHKYTDCIFCFNCKNKKVFPIHRLNYNLINCNGYLARKNKNTKGIEFFHRILMKDSVRHHPSLEIHHINFDKKDNRLINLQALNPSVHELIHSRNLLDSEVHEAYKKFCDTNKKEYSDFEWGEFFNKI